MTAPLEDPAVVAYLAELARLLGDAPDRPLVLEGVQQHIQDALEGNASDPRRVRTVLDELGDPATIAAESVAAPLRQDAPFLQRRGGAILVVLLLAFGGFVVPVIGWAVGVVLLWASAGWRIVDKLVGTFAPAVVAAVLLGVSVLLPPEVRFAHLALLGGLVIGLVAAGAYLLSRFRPARPRDA